MTRRTFQSLTHAVEAYYAELRRFVVRRTGSVALADDVIQETWIRANAASAAAMPDNPRAYLYRLAGNLAFDHLRRGNRFADSATDSQVLEQVACADPAPDAVVAARQEVALLAAAVRELPEKCRMVFLLYRGHGLTMRQIAARLAISDKTVEKHIARAMVHCRQRLRAAGRNV